MSAWAFTPIDFLYLMLPYKDGNDQLRILLYFDDQWPSVYKNKSKVGSIYLNAVQTLQYSYDSVIFFIKGMTCCWELWGAVFWQKYNKWGNCISEGDSLLQQHGSFLFPPVKSVTLIG